MSLDFVNALNSAEHSKTCPEMIVAPTCDVDGLLTGPILLNLLAQVNNEFSPTPGDPHSVYIRDNVEYVASTQLFMQSQLYEAAHAMGLLYAEDIIPVIDDEIVTQHERRCRANGEANTRLLGELNESGIKTVPQPIANLFWRYRTGFATPSEGAEMLMRYPIMSGVEAAKIMQLFDYEAIKQLDIHAHRELLKVRQHMLNQGIDAGISLSAGERSNLSYMVQSQPVESDSGHGVCIIVAKKTVGEVRADGLATIQLKRKVSYAGFPPDTDLIGGKKNIMNMRGIPYDMRPIGGSYYWCTTDEASMIGQSALVAAKS